MDPKTPTRHEAGRAADAPSATDDSEHQYQTARGCLMMILGLVLLTAISLLAIWLFGDHTAPAVHA